MNINCWKIALIVLVAFALFGLGLWVGTKHDSEPQIIYTPGETITDTLYLEKPSEEVPPHDTLDIIKQCIKDGMYADLWPERVDTLWMRDTCYVPTPEDTTRIMRDWVTKRFYSNVLFNDEKQGYFDYSAEIQYNRLSSFSYNFTPVVKEVTQTKTYTKFMSPFVGLYYLTNPWDEVKNPSIQINAGVFLKDRYGISILYQRGFTVDNDHIGAGLLIKF